MEHPHLIVMLTHQDHTVSNAAEIFEACKHSKAQFWGFKEDGLPFEEMKALFATMHEYGKTTVLEVVAYSEEECLQGARMAVSCGCDILMGTHYFDSVNQYCQENSLKYMPFAGTVTQRPSILNGSPEDMVQEANFFLSQGVYGVDLLGYRYTGDAPALIQQFVPAIDAPVCIAGSINSYQRLDEVVRSGAWAFTIGGAFFENAFDGSFAEQIDKVCDYVRQAAAQGVGS